MLNGHLDAIHRAQDAAAKFFEAVGKVLDFGGRFGKEFVETIAESGVVGRKCCQHPRVVERIAERRLERADPRDNAGIHE